MKEYAFLGYYTIPQLLGCPNQLPLFGPCSQSLAELIDQANAEDEKSSVRIECSRMQEQGIVTHANDGLSNGQNTTSRGAEL